MNDQPSRLLIVDDDPELLQFLLDEMRSADFHCTGFNNGQEALLICDSRRLISPSLIGAFRISAAWKSAPVCAKPTTPLPS